MKFETILEQVIAGIFIGICTYLYLMPFIHEGGHALYAHFVGWEVLEIQISVPIFVVPSFVRIQVPLGTNLAFFYMAGSWSCVLWGFMISLFPIFIKDHWLWLSIGYSLMSDAIIYPIYSNIALFGDWFEVSFVASVFTVGMVLLLILFSVLLNNITKRRFGIKW